MEVAHDTQLQVSKFVTGDLKLINSFDKGVTWFPQLVDKRKYM